MSMAWYLGQILHHPPLLDAVHIYPPLPSRNSQHCLCWEIYPHTAWPNGSYSEKMPRHIGPYWGVIWTIPITSIPRAKCSTWKLGQNGLIWPFLRSFWLYHGIYSFFFHLTGFFSLKLMPLGDLSTYGYISGQSKKKTWSI